MSQSFRFNSNYDDWSLSSDAVVEGNNRCPSGGHCLILPNYDDEAYIYVSTIGYHSIELTYTLSSNGLGGSQYCELWYIVDKKCFDCSDWTELAEDRKNDGSITKTESFPSEADNKNILGIDLYAEIGGGSDACYYNDIILTGIPITESPTPAPSPAPTGPTSSPTPAPTPAPSPSPTPTPTPSPSPTPTFHPTNDPTNNPTATPTISTLNPSQFPSNYPSQDPTANPTKHPSPSPTKNPTANPTVDPTTEPTFNPTLKSGEVGGAAGSDTTVNEDKNNVINEDETNLFDDPFIIYVIAGSTGLFVCILCGVFLCFCRRKKRKKSNLVESLQLSNHRSIVSQSVVSKESTANTHINTNYSGYGQENAVGLQQQNITRANMENEGDDDEIIQMMNKGVTPNGLINPENVMLSKKISITPNGTDLDEEDSVDDIENNEDVLEGGKSENEHSVDEIENNPLVDNDDNDIVQDLQFATPAGPMSVLQAENDMDDDDDEVILGMITKG